MRSSVAGVAGEGTPQGSPRAARPPLWREVVLGLAVFGLYALVTASNGAGRRAAADAHSRDIFDLERTLHLDIERALNSWLLQHNTLRVGANYEYAFTYIVSAALLLVWLYMKRPDLDRWARTSFVILNLIGISCFALYPVTPPRLLPSLGFVDTVTRGHTFGSWGSSAVDDANSLAAMPSLHLAWALWVSVVLGCLAGSLLVQGISFVHVMVTLFVIMATANHYLLDAGGGAICVILSVVIAGWFSTRPTRHGRPPRVAAADAFFLYVETPADPQQVGGLLLLRHGGDTGKPSRDELESVVRRNLGELPRFQQRVSAPTRWRRPRWLTDPDLDWAWHVTEHDLSRPDGEPAGVEALHAYVAELQATRLPRDRPMWRLVAVHGVTRELSAVVFIAHHVIADGFGTVMHAVALLEPEVTSLDAGSLSPPGWFVRAGATVKGIAQLATDRHSHLAPARDRCARPQLRNCRHAPRRGPRRGAAARRTHDRPAAQPGCGRAEESRRPVVRRARRHAPGLGDAHGSPWRGRP